MLVAARASIGTHETSPNSGPDIDRWLANVGHRPGDPWCAAWVHEMHKMAAAICLVENPYPKTAGALRTWDMADPSWRETLPAPGDVFVVEHDNGRGHVGIVELVTPDSQTIVSIEGNTNAAGSREGDQVAKHAWKPSEGRRGRLVGYINFSLSIPADMPATDDPRS